MLLLTTFLLIISPLCSGFQIVSPATGSAIDPSQELNIIWTSSSADPANISFTLQQTSDPMTLGANTQLTGDVPTKDGRVTIPPYTITTYGSGFEITAADKAGQQVGESHDLTLTDLKGTVQTQSNGGLSFVSTATNTNVRDGATSTSTVTSESSQTAASASSSSGGGGGGGNSTSTGTGTGSSASDAGSSSPQSGFVTSSATRTESATGSKSSSDSSSSSTTQATSAPDTNTANRLGVAGVMAFPAFLCGEAVVMGAAGLVAGAVALLV